MTSEPRITSALRVARITKHTFNEIPVGRGGSFEIVPGAAGARAQSFVTDDHIEHIVKTYENLADEPGFARVAPPEEIRPKMAV
jgi:hypothetical protein